MGHKAGGGTVAEGGDTGVGHAVAGAVAREQVEDPAVRQAAEQRRRGVGPGRGPPGASHST